MTQAPLKFLHHDMARRFAQLLYKFQYEVSQAKVDVPTRGYDIRFYCGGGKPRIKLKEGKVSKALSLAKKISCLVPMNVIVSFVWHYPTEHVFVAYKYVCGFEEGKIVKKILPLSIDPEMEEQMDLYFAERRPEVKKVYSRGGLGNEEKSTEEA